MSRSALFRTTSRDQSPLLPISLRDLSLPGTSTSTPSRSVVSSSPPPSFYRDHNFDLPSPSFSPAPSSRTKSPQSRTIQFAAPPPPITASVFLGRGGVGARKTVEGEGRHTFVRRSSSGQSDALVVLERREKALQHELQLLLDAQSAGLLQGFGAGGDTRDGGSDAGSSTPTMRSGDSEGRRKSVVPVRQPKRRVITLQSARRGLGKDMEELVAVKDEEDRVLEAEMARRKEVLGKVTGWEERMETVRSQLSGFSGGGELELGGGEEAMEIAELQTEENAVEIDIRECEERLAEMWGRQKWLKERIKEGVNRREARLSSYKGALKEVEREVGEFLKRPPIERSVVMATEEESFTGLPAHRRTLGMAREWWSKELSHLQSKKAVVEKEREALAAGEKMWADCVKVVTGFEKDLQSQMKSPQPQDPEMLRRQIEKMQMVIERLSDHSHVAEERGWNLLICAVGAELAAFKEGEAILNEALGVMEKVHSNNGVGDEDGGREESFHSFDDGDPLLGLSLNGTEQNLHLVEGKQVRVAGSVSGSEEDSDGPNLAELLVDRGIRRRGSEEVD